MFRCFDPDDSASIAVLGCPPDTLRATIVTETRSNDAYAQVLANGTQTSVTNGITVTVHSIPQLALPDPLS